MIFVCLLSCRSLPFHPCLCGQCAKLLRGRVRGSRVLSALACLRWWRPQRTEATQPSYLHVTFLLLGGKFVRLFQSRAPPPPSELSTHFIHSIHPPSADRSAVSRYATAGCGSWLRRAEARAWGGRARAELEQGGGARARARAELDRALAPNWSSSTSSSALASSSAFKLGSSFGARAELEF